MNDPHDNALDDRAILAQLEEPDEHVCDCGKVYPTREQAAACDAADWEETEQEIARQNDGVDE